MPIFQQIRDIFRRVLVKSEVQVLCQFVDLFYERKFQQIHPTPGKVITAKVLGTKEVPNLSARP